MKSLRDYCYGSFPDSGLRRLNQKYYVITDTKIEKDPKAVSPKNKEGKKILGLDIEVQAIANLPLYQNPLSIGENISLFSISKKSSSNFITLIDEGCGKKVLSGLSNEDSVVYNAHVFLPAKYVNDHIMLLIHAGWNLSEPGGNFPFSLFGIFPRSFDKTITINK